MFSVGFAVANAVEALLVVRWLTGFEVEQPQLRSLGRLPAVADRHRGRELCRRRDHRHDDRHHRRRRAVAAADRGSRSRTSAPRRSPCRSACASPGIGSGSPASRSPATSGCSRWARSRCFNADASQPVGVPDAPGADVGLGPLRPSLGQPRAARGRGRDRAAHDPGPAGRSATSPDRRRCWAISASSQTFVAVCAITSVAFSVATSHLRDSLQRIRRERAAAGPAARLGERHGVHRHRSRRADHLVQPRARSSCSATPARRWSAGSRRCPSTRTARSWPAPGSWGSRPATRWSPMPSAWGAEQDTRDWTYVRKDGSRLRSRSASPRSGTPTDGRRAS